MKVDTVVEDTSPVSLAAVRAEFDASVTYLDAATFGLPPRCRWVALQPRARVPRESEIWTTEHAPAIDRRPVGLQAFVPHFESKARNLTAALADGRLRAVQGIARAV